LPNCVHCRKDLPTEFFRYSLSAESAHYACVSVVNFSQMDQHLYAKRISRTSEINARSRPRVAQAGGRRAEQSSGSRFRGGRQGEEERNREGAC
jgi:hypothetical protein